MSNVKINAGIFLKRDFHMKAGMKYLIEAFYRSIREIFPSTHFLPRDYPASRIIDSIFAQLDESIAASKSVAVE